MKTPIALLLILSLSYNTYAQTRQKTLINFDWKFIKKDLTGAEAIDYDDSPWQTVDLPHDASISGPFVQDSLNSDRKNGYLPRQKGWYRKTIHLAPKQLNKKIFLEFEGIYRDARVFVNGQLLAHQLNGFESFLVDMTEVAKNGDNQIAVSYDNTDMESSRWYNGEGIYRDVFLIVTDPVHIPYHGIFISTPTITSILATAHVQTEAINERSFSCEIKLISEIYTPDGKKSGEMINVAPVNPKETFVFKQDLDIVKPVLWDLKTPELYVLTTKLYVNDSLADEMHTSFGIRSIEFDRDRGLLLNGQKVLVKGVNIHHDLGPLGAAAFERGYERRLEGLKKLGCNAIRLSHNPHDSFILDWCDRNGMLIFDEAFDKWQDQFFGKGNSFDAHWEESLENFVKRDRNHPSVFIWSMGNETHQQRDPKKDFGVPQLQKMMAKMQVLDPTRKVTCGLHPSRKSGAYRTENYYREGPPEMALYMDVVSTNYREEFWPMDRSNYPQLSFILSEAQVGNLGNEWFNFNHDYAVGLFYWGGTDYIGESFGWPAKGWPNGIIDWNDHWKPFSYYIQSLYSDKPMVHIVAYDKESETSKYWNEVKLRYQPMYDHWNWQGKDSVRVLTITNAQEVELFLNGKSLGVKKVPDVYYTKDIKAYTAEEYDPDHPINTGPDIHKELEWTIPYEPGTLKAISKINGKIVATHTLQTAGDAAHINLSAARDTITADGMDLSYVTVEVTDKAGNIVPDAYQNIQFKVKGPAQIAGVGNADITFDGQFTANHIRVFQGKALLILRSKKESGAIKINAKAKGVKTGTLTIFSD